MPDLKTIRSAVAELSNGQPLVVVLAGGTTGIGSYVAASLAKTFASNGSKLRVYIVGRNAVRAKAVMEQSKSVSPDSDWRFIQATDLALISEVDRSCAEIIRQESEAPFHGTPSIDLLYMSHCYPILKKPMSRSLSYSFNTLNG
jgi:NAD(P)-dependent dehydrogenase (short-subunit alcohol dehydrogenase family)